MAVSVFPWEHALGAHPARGDGRVTFRTWAPRADRVAVRVRGRDHALEPEGSGVHCATVEAAHGDPYWFVLDGTPWPDPCSRWQPEGLRGPSAVVDPGALRWTDAGFAPAALRDAVVYELHVGTFSAAGTFDGAVEHLAGLAELGVTHLELMPVAEFPGARGWGYDGVYLSAAQSSYGGPDGLARLVDAAHGHGLGVLLDVVYNHVGASGGQALEAYGPYFTDKHSTFWGAALNYDDADCDPVREWVLQSAEGWVRDFHLDGLRLDAIHAIYDDSAHPLVGEVARRVHRARPRTLVIAESGLNDPRVMRPAQAGGLGCDAAWADDFHHALRTLLTGEREGYYEEFGSVADLVKAYGRPHVHDGTFSTFRGRRFGAKADDVAPEAFVVFSSNHDQVGNRAVGDRLPAEIRPLAAFATLLSPFTPMLFQGEEYGEDAPFQFFTDHIDEDIATATREGRRREFASFAAFAGEEVPDPQDPATFERSKLTRQGDPAVAALYATLLRVRSELPRRDVAADADPGERWVRVRRGPFTLLMNVTREPVSVASEASAIVVATHDGVALRDGTLRLPPLAGALVR